MKQEESNLNHLAIAHYVLGGIGILFACMPLMHFFVGLSFVIGGEGMWGESENPPPPVFGWLFMIMGAAFFVIGQAMAISIVVSGRFINKRKNYMFSFVTACILCAFAPLGTVLGVFTIISLSKDSVKKDLYGRV